MMSRVGFVESHLWVVGVTTMVVYLALFSLYYRRRRRTNLAVKDHAAHIFTDLAEQLGGQYEREDQTPSSLYSYAGLGRIIGGTPRLAYEVGCLTRSFEDVGGRLSCTVRPAGGSEVFDVPAGLGHWSGRSTGRQDGVRELFGRSYAQRMRPDAEPAVVGLAGMSFAVQIHPTHVTAYAPPEVYDWPERLDNPAAVRWIQAVLALIGTLPRRAR